MSSLTAIEPKITILGKDVNMVDGLYSLNDMHVISGSDKKHQPHNFMRNQEVKDLIEELQCSSDMRNKQVFTKLVSGKNRGTYVCKELVYRYAMWVSSKFALIVIRTFDDLVNKRLENNGYQLGDLQRLSDEVDAEYAIGFSYASKDGKGLSNWRVKKSHLDARKAVINDLMQPLLTGFNEAKAVGVVK